MKRNTLICIGLVLVIAALRQSAMAQTSNVVSYQGYLNDGGVAANVPYDISWRIYNAESGGSPLGEPAMTPNVPVRDGLFTAQLDLAAMAALENTSYIDPDGPAVWLELSVRKSGSSGAFETLRPRQRLTSAPHALYATMARTVPDGSVTPSKLAPGAVGSAVLQDGAITGPKIADGSLVRSLNGIQDNVKIIGEDGLMVRTVADTIVLAPAPASCLTYSNCYWNLLGNGNITAGVNFLGTVAGEFDPLEFRVNNNRSMLYVFTTPFDAANLIGGHAVNGIAGGFFGSTIGGGGSVGGPQSISAHYGTVAGGVGNQIDHFSHFSAIGGGATNKIDDVSTNSTIAGGLLNVIGPSSSGSAIGGGTLNTILPASHFGTIGGGTQNRIASNSTHSVVGGGVLNLIDPSSRMGTIGGGGTNRIFTSSEMSTIGGGMNNATRSPGSTIGGGVQNSIQGSASGSSIGGGNRNSIYMASLNSTISGGSGNLIETNVQFGTIGGGSANDIKTDAYYSTIGGGNTNTIGMSARFSTIAGGGNNLIETGPMYVSVGGGNANRVQSGANFATEGGGAENLIFGTAPYATIPGGYRAAATNYGQIAYASGYFSGQGDAQTCIYVVRTNTTTASTNELFLDGITQRIKVRPDSTWTFDVLVTARSSGGISAGYKLRGVIENSAGVTALIGGFDTEMVKEEAAAAPWNAWVEADNVNDALVVKVVGAANTSIRWVASVRTAETKW